MTEKGISLYKACTICTGCGRCAGLTAGMDIVTAGTEELPEPEIVEEYSESEIVGEYSESKRKAEPSESGIVAEGPGKNRSEEGLASRYAAVADIGTTTIAMVLRRLSDGRCVDVYKALNPQRRFGTDVLSRIQAAEKEENRTDMRRLVTEELEKGIRQFEKFLEGYGPETGEEVSGETARICGVYIAGNTAMVYLFQGYDTSPLGYAPFTAEHLAEVRTAISGIPAVLLPGISAFVGGDIAAGIYACSMHRKEEICLLIDLGTNGEMVLGNRRRLVAAAAAAGPAFEGGSTAGIWGAEMTALIAKALEAGLVDDTGLLQDPYFEQGIRIGGAVVTQKDIRQFQMAKAAVCAGVQLLCRQYGLRNMEQIDTVYLAGGFGYYLRPDAAVAVGLIPVQLKGKIKAVGNTALEGAFRYGRDLERQGGKTMQAVTAGVEAVNLAMQEEFNDLYIASMNLEEAVCIY